MTNFRRKAVKIALTALHLHLNRMNQLEFSALLEDANVVYSGA